MYRAGRIRNIMLLAPAFPNTKTNINTNTKSNVIILLAPAFPDQFQAAYHRSPPKKGRLRMKIKIFMSIMLVQLTVVIVMTDHQKALGMQ